MLYVISRHARQQFSPQSNSVDNSINVIENLGVYLRLSFTRKVKKTMIKCKQRSLLARPSSLVTSPSDFVHFPLHASIKQKSPKLYVSEEIKITIQVAKYTMRRKPMKLLLGLHTSSRGVISEIKLKGGNRVKMGEPCQNWNRDNMGDCDKMGDCKNGNHVKRGNCVKRGNHVRRGNCIKKENCQKGDSYANASYVGGCTSRYLM